METVTTKSFGRRLAEGRQTNGRRPVDAPEVQARKGRSRVTNGSVLIPDVPQTSPWVRRCRDLIAAHTSDLGGKDHISQAELSIIRRCATLTVALEQMEVEFARVGAADANSLDTYQRASSSLRRLLESLGLRRRTKNVVPTLDQYLASQREAAE
jgi:hypothetical protein